MVLNGYLLISNSQHWTILKHFSVKSFQAARADRDFRVARRSVACLESSVFRRQLEWLEEYRRQTQQQDRSPHQCHLDDQLPFACFACLLSAYLLRIILFAEINFQLRRSSSKDLSLALPVWPRKNLPTLLQTSAFSWKSDALNAHF